MLHLIRVKLIKFNKQLKPYLLMSNAHDDYASSIDVGRV